MWVSGREVNVSTGTSGQEKSDGGEERKTVRGPLPRSCAIAKLRCRNQRLYSNKDTNEASVRESTEVPLGRKG